MLWAGIGIAVVLVAWLSLLAARHTQSGKNPLWTQLVDRRKEVQSHLASHLEKLPALGVSDIEAPSEVPALQQMQLALHDKTPKENLEQAEEETALHPSDPSARLGLALALLNHRDFAAASEQVRKAQSFGAQGPLFHYLSCLTELEEYLHAIDENTVHAKRSALMPVEVLALELHVRLAEAGDASPLWMPGHDGELSQDEARAFVLAHFSGYYRLLETMLELVSNQPFVDGYYLIGRLALKCGFGEEAARIFKHIETLMEGSRQERNFRRDMALLRGESSVVEVVHDQEGKSKLKLKVLN